MNSPKRATRSPLELSWFALIAFFCVSAVFCEVGARLDDLFFDGIAFSANPSYEALSTVDADGLRHGIPGARWKKVTINNLGFKGPDVPLERPEGCERWVFMGASETFGEPALADGDYPSRVRLALSGGACTHVVNAAFPGIPPQQLLAYYDRMVKRLSPTVVFIYPSTHFYLADVSDRDTKQPIANESKAPVVKPSPSIGSLLAESRFLERLKDTAEVPAVIQRRRVSGWIDAQTRDKPSGWQFQKVPTDRLEALDADIVKLIKAIKASGAQPVILTHAVRATVPPRADDHDDLFAMRVYIPRTTELVIAEFEYQAADRVRTIAKREGIPMVDVANQLSGHRDLFVDLVHFSPTGNDKVAQIIVDSSRQLATR